MANFYTMKRKDNIFTKVQLRKPQRSTFDLSHDIKTSAEIGELIPTLCMEVLPGDRFRLDSATMIRLAPMVSPVMHQMRTRTDYFFVANRTLWPGWENFITGKDAPAVPTIASDEWFSGKLADYLGMVPNTYGTNVEISALPFAAYAKIWDEYYRSQDLQDEVFQPLVNGNNNINYLDFANGDLLKRGWGHDYFTSALPFAQKGPAVSIPLVDEQDIPVEFRIGFGPSQVVNPTTGLPVTGTPLSADASGNLETNVSGTPTDSAIDPAGNLVVDIQAQATDINSLRWAVRMQEWLERNARAGTRYVESLLAHFGVRSSDARLQRPEFIGASYGKVTISEVLALSQNESAELGNQPLGQMGGHGISVSGSQQFTYTAEEHGWIFAIVSVLPDTAYMDGLHKKFFRTSIYDYAWPSFASLGEQTILNKEIYLPSVDTNQGEEVFGYIPRYAEYKYEPSRVSAEMRTSLLYWNMGRKFTALPVLNEDFIQCQTDNRIFAVQSEATDHLFFHIFNNVSVNRALPYYGIPTL